MFWFLLLVALTISALPLHDGCCLPVTIVAPILNDPFTPADECCRIQELRRGVGQPAVKDNGTDNNPPIEEERAVLAEAIPGTQENAEAQTEETAASSDSGDASLEGDGRVSTPAVTIEDSSTSHINPANICVATMLCNQQVETFSKSINTDRATSEMNVAGVEFSNESSEITRTSFETGSSSPVEEVVSAVTKSTDSPSISTEISLNTVQSTVEINLAPAVTMAQAKQKQNLLESEILVLTANVSSLQKAGGPADVTGENVVDVESASLTLDKLALASSSSPDDDQGCSCNHQSAEKKDAVPNVNGGLFNVSSLVTATMLSAGKKSESILVMAAEIRESLHFERKQPEGENLAAEFGCQSQRTDRSNVSYESNRSTEQFVAVAESTPVPLPLIAAHLSSTGEQGNSTAFTKRMSFLPGLCCTTISTTETNLAVTSISQGCLLTPLKIKKRPAQLSLPFDPAYDAINSSMQAEIEFVPEHPEVSAKSSQLIKLTSLEISVGIEMESSFEPAFAAFVAEPAGSLAGIKDVAESEKSSDNMQSTRTCFKEQGLNEDVPTGSENCKVYRAGSVALAKEKELCLCEQLEAETIPMPVDPCLPLGNAESRHQVLNKALCSEYEFESAAKEPTLQPEKEDLTHQNAKRSRCNNSVSAEEEGGQRDVSFMNPEQPNPAESLAAAVHTVGHRDADNSVSVQDNGVNGQDRNMLAVLSFIVPPLYDPPSPPMQAGRWWNNVQPECPHLLLQPHLKRRGSSRTR